MITWAPPYDSVPIAWPPEAIRDKPGGQTGRILLRFTVKYKAYKTATQCGCGWSHPAARGLIAPTPRPRWGHGAVPALRSLSRAAAPLPASVPEIKVLRQRPGRGNEGPKRGLNPQAAQ